MPEPLKDSPRFHRRLRIAMWLAFIGGPVMLAIGGYEYVRASKLKTEGAKIPGILVASNTLNTGKGRVSHRITLDYKPAGANATYRKEFVVAEPIYDRARQDGQVPVTYLPSDPRVSTAGDDVPIETEQFAIGGGLIVFAFVVWLVLRRQTRRVEDKG